MVGFLQETIIPEKSFAYKKFKISFGMNRLAVIDKKKGNQPMFSHDGRHLLIFNDEM